MKNELNSADFLVKINNSKTNNGNGRLAAYAGKTKEIKKKTTMIKWMFKNRLNFSDAELKKHLK